MLHLTSKYLRHLAGCVLAAVLDKAELLKLIGAFRKILKEKDTFEPSLGGVDLLVFKKPIHNLEGWTFSTDSNRTIKDMLKRVQDLINAVSGNEEMAFISDALHESSWLGQLNEHGPAGTDSTEHAIAQANKALDYLENLLKKPVPQKYFDKEPEKKYPFTPTPHRLPTRIPGDPAVQEMYEKWRRARVQLGLPVF